MWEGRRILSSNQARARVSGIKETPPTLPTGEQRGSVHACSTSLPKRLQGQAKAALHERMDAPTRTDAEKAIDSFADSYETNHPEAVAALVRDHEPLLTLFDFPTRHWLHIRTSSAVESPFATAR